MDDRLWYENGWVILAVLIVAVIFGPMIYRTLQQNDMGGFESQVTGQISQPIFGQPEFVFTIWHLHPDDIKNGRVKITVNSPLLRTKDKTKMEPKSFKVWSPNRDNELSFRFPLSHFDPQTKIRVHVEFSSRNVAAHQYSLCWLGDGWERTPAEPN